MENKLIYASITLLVSMFIKIVPMRENSKKQNSHTITLPSEINILILEKAIQAAIESSNIFDVYSDIKDFINTIRITSTQFRGFEAEKFLSNFAKKYIQKYYAKNYIGLTQKDKNSQLENIIEKPYSKESEIKAAKLIIAGADPNLIIKEKQHCLNSSLLNVIAETGEFINLINILLQHGANINVQEPCCKWTPLMGAVHNNRKKMINILLNRKDINVNTKDLFNSTPLIVACSKGYNKITKLLLKHTDVNLNAKGPCGDTALICAAENGYKKIVKLLLTTNHIDVNAINNNGKTALDTGTPANSLKKSLIF